MLMPGRSYQGSDDYRYGFGGHEKDDEIKGSGNLIGFGARGYDSRLGRWWSIDPKDEWYPAYSPYSYAANSPLTIVDREGEFLGTIIGAAVGAVVGGTVAAIKGDNVWEGIGKGTISGTIAGAVFDITLYTAGTGTVALVAAGALSGAAGNASHQGLDLADGSRDEFSYSELGISTALGGGLGYLGARLGGAISRGLSRLFGRGKGGISVGQVRTVTSTQTAEEANAAFVAQNINAKPPYAPGTVVMDEITITAEKFVRVYTQGVTNAEGRWIMAASEIEGLTPAQIADKFSLPNMPTHIVDVTVAEGMAIRESVAGAVEG